MSETKNTGLNEKAQDEKLGAYLRRSRLAAQMELADLARKIRISPDVLQNIEDSKWETFPVEAYVRGYLNSICIHLELDRKKVLEWFSSEYNSEYVMPVAALRDIGMVESPSAGTSGSKLVPVLIVALIVVFFVAMNLLRGTEEEAPLPVAPAPVVSPEPSADSVPVQDSVLQDTLAFADTSKNAEPVVVPEPIPEAAPVAQGKETNIKLECIRDSVWVRIKRTGEKTRTYQIKEGSPRFFSHTDTIMVRIAAPERTRLYINNGRVRFGDSKDLTVYNGKLIKSEP